VDPIWGSSHKGRKLQKTSGVVRCFLPKVLRASTTFQGEARQRTELLEAWKNKQIASQRKAGHFVDSIKTLYVKRVHTEPSINDFLSYSLPSSDDYAEICW
jgi:hypothetical protein